MAPKKEQIDTEETKIVEEKPEPTVPLSKVQEMIEKAMANFKEEEKPIKPKRVTEHTAHVWRFDGKWVVDFKDRNTDPYIKEKIFSFQKYNEQRREFESWIELVFNDGSTKEIPLTTYMKNRTPIYCAIIKREKIDKSYSVGEVEKRKEVNDQLVGTGVMIDQEVVMYEEIFEVKTPEGEVLKLSADVIA
jgi:hypothetical protein